MKLLVDMNLSPRWIGLLTSSGLQAVHWSTVGRMAVPHAERTEVKGTSRHMAPRLESVLEVPVQLADDRDALAGISSKQSESANDQSGSAIRKSL